MILIGYLVDRKFKKNIELNKYFFSEEEFHLNLLAMNVGITALGFIVNIQGRHREFDI
jgi:hypothetical protein